MIATTAASRLLGVALAAIACVGVFAASDAHAQEDDNCHLTLSETIVDLGRVNRTLQAVGADEVLLGHRTVLLTMICQEPADLTLTYRAVASGTGGFRFFGSDDAFYTITARNAVVDNESAQLGLIEPNGEAPVSIAPAQPLLPGKAIVPIRSGNRADGSSLSVVLDIEGWADQRAIQVADAVNWHAEGAVEAVRADSSEDLSILVALAPAACSIALTNAGRVDFGLIPMSRLSPTENTVLPPHSLGLTVNCDSATRFALSLQDERAGTSILGTAASYGLSRDAAGNRIGSYEVTVDPQQTQAHQGALPVSRVYLTESANGGLSWTSATSDSAKLTPGLLAFTDEAGSLGGPAALSHASAVLAVQATLAPSAALDQTDRIVLDGHARLLITYP